MKTLFLLAAVLTLTPLAALAQSQNVTQQKSTKRVYDDIAIGSGRTLSVESGATITVSPGATVTGLAGNVTGPLSSTAGQVAVFSDATGRELSAFAGTGVVTAASGVLSGTLTPSLEQVLHSEISSPSTPATGVASLYVKADGTLYGKDDAGTERSFVGPVANRLAKTSAYTVVAADRGAVIDCTSGTFSVTLTAAATLGAGYSVAVYNSGSGTITIDPNSSETIRDPSGSATTKTLAQGAGYILFCDGAGWLVVATASSAGATGTVTFSANTITGTTSGNTEVTTSVSNADVRLIPNGTGHVVINPRSVIEGITSGNYGLYLRGNVGSSNGIFIAADTGDQARGNNIGARIGFVDDGAYGDHIDFLTKSTGGSSTTTGHRVRITSNSSTGGNVLIGTTDTTGLTGAGGLKLNSTTTSTTTATGALIVPGGAGIAGPLYTQQPVVARTTALSVAANQTRALFTNEGATAQVIFTLPTAVAGYEYTYVVQDTDGIRVTAASGDTIRIAGTVTAAAGYVENATIGGTLTLVSINATEWLAVASQGTWTFGP